MTHHVSVQVCLQSGMWAGICVCARDGERVVGRCDSPCMPTCVHGK